MKVAFSVNGEFFEFKYVESSVRGAFPAICIGSEGKVNVNYGAQGEFAYPPTMDNLRGNSINEIVACAFDNPQYFPDVVFVFSMTTDTLFAHKAVLSARSKFFRMLFAKNPSPKVKVEVIAIDENPILFRKVIQYLYTGNLSIDSKMEAIDIIGLAARYRLTFLAQRAQDAITHEFSSNGYSLLFSLATLDETTDNVSDIIRFMDSVHAKGLTESAISKNFNEIPQEVARRSAISKMMQTNNTMRKRDIPFHIAEPAHLFRRDMLWLAENPCFADVSLAVSSDLDREVKCHRFMLSLTSFYFKNVFQSMYAITKQKRKEKLKEEEEEHIRATKATPELQPPPLPVRAPSVVDDSKYTINVCGMKFPRFGNKIKIGTTLIDPASVESLTEIGFPTDAVVWVLLETNLNVNRAADWLLTMAVSEANKAKLRQMISQTLDEMKAAQKFGGAGAGAGSASGASSCSSMKEPAKRKELFYCAGCMSLSLMSESTQCNGGCMLCEDCILETFKKYINTTGASEPIPYSIGCPVPSCSAAIQFSRVKSILGVTGGLGKSSFRLLIGQRGLARAERMTKRAPFKLVYPEGLVTVKALKDYVNWLYSGLNGDLAVFKKKTNENIIKTAFNASDLFKDSHYKYALAKHKKLLSKYSIDKLYVWGNTFDCKILIDKCVKDISKDFMNTFFERKYLTWSKELSERIMNGLLAEVEDSYGMVPIATIFAYKNHKKYPDVELFSEAYRSLYSRVNINIILIILNISIHIHI